MLTFVMSIGHAILVPLYYATSGILVVFHGLFNGVLGIPAGLSWALGIVGLTVVIRTLLIPLFVKQIKNSRNLQLLQPKVKELQKKFGHDRERLTQETMKLYKETGTNPLASCLPLLLQMPIFIGLFRTLNNAAQGFPVGFLTSAQVDSLKNNVIFGTAKISESFTSSTHVGTKVLAAALVILMTVTTFTTQRQLMRKNMPDSAMTGQYAQQQKMLLYILPLVFAVSGVAFPIGVLLYWTTSNLWTMGQQFYVIRNNPTPGTPAFEAKRSREALRGSGVIAAAPEVGPAPETRRPPQRNQPKRQTRDQRRSQPKTRSEQAKPEDGEPNTL